MVSSEVTTVNGYEESTPHNGEKLLAALDENSHGPIKDLLFLPIPQRLQYTPDKTFEFGIWMNCGISLAASFRAYLPVSFSDFPEKNWFYFPVVSNLYYCQPLLSTLE